MPHWYLCQWVEWSRERRIRQSEGFCRDVPGHEVKTSIHAAAGTGEIHRFVYLLPGLKVLLQPAIRPGRPPCVEPAGVGVVSASRPAFSLSDLWIRLQQETLGWRWRRNATPHYRFRVTPNSCSLTRPVLTCWRGLFFVLSFPRFHCFRSGLFSPGRPGRAWRLRERNRGPRGGSGSARA